jgi:hypothetical protein
MWSVVILSFRHKGTLGRSPEAKLLHSSAGGEHTTLEFGSKALSVPRDIIPHVLRNTLVQNRELVRSEQGGTSFLFGVRGFNHFFSISSSRQMTVQVGGKSRDDPFSIKVRGRPFIGHTVLRTIPFRSTVAPI